MARYTYQHIDTEDKHITICYSRYAGKKISAKTVCAPGDTYDPIVGENIARAKLDVKVQNIRIAKHNKKIEDCRKAIIDLQNRVWIEQKRCTKDEIIRQKARNIINQYR